LEANRVLERRLLTAAQGNDRLEAPIRNQFGVHFRLVKSSKELHRTPLGGTQQFLYRYCRVQ
jgi:hypothetical protein